MTRTNEFSRYRRVSAAVVILLACGTDSGADDFEPGSGPGAGTAADDGATDQGEADDAGPGDSPTSADDEGSSGGGPDDSGSDAGPIEVPTCADPAPPGLPAGAPEYRPGVWVDITPPELVPGQGDPEVVLGQGIALDPCNPTVVYWGNTPFNEAEGGIYRTIDAGGTWIRLGDPSDVDAEDLHVTYLDQPVHVRVDPVDSQHMYAGDGVRGSTLGFWESHDGGLTWDMPPAFFALDDQHQIFVLDVYDVAVNPADFDHVLVASHSVWDDTSSGVLESRDGGDSWTVHPKEDSWGAGHSIDFLYAPKLGVGDADTWLLGTQGDGYWRTTDAGATWTQVDLAAIVHGGGDSYYSHTGVLYSSAEWGVLRSTNNGESFEVVGPRYGISSVFGDGTRLYTAPAYGFGPLPYMTSPERDGTAWNDYAPSQTFDLGGPFEMAFDEVNGILYASSWNSGVWALRVER